MKWIITSIFALSTLALSGQEQRFISRSAILTHYGFSYALPGGDLSARFGGFGGIEAGVGYLFPSGNWMLSSGFQFRFGNKVKEDVLGPLRNERGNVVGSDGFPADIVSRQRCYDLHLRLNYLINLWKESDDHFSLVIGAGIGMMEHWIRLQDDRNTARQIIGDYALGYDRRTNGWTTHQYLGLQYLQANKRINFYAGFEFVQGYTRSIRPWNFDTMEADNKNRLDLLNGFKIGWILPFYLNENPEVIYY